MCGSGAEVSKEYQASHLLPCVCPCVLPFFFGYVGPLEYQTKLRNPKNGTCKESSCSKMAP